MKDILIALINMQGCWFVFSAPWPALAIYALIRLKLKYDHYEYMARNKLEH